MPLSASATRAEFILTPLTSFSDTGWLSPSDTTQLAGSNVQRGVAYNGAADQVYVVDRNGGNFARIFQGSSGASVGNLDLTGLITGTPGGTFPLNMIDVADDGAIYAANLSNATSNFHIYRWANPTAVPTLAYSAVNGFPRTGDSFAVTGSGADTRIIASGSTTSGISVFDTVDGISFTQTAANPFSGTPTPPAGALRLGLDFVDSSTAIGKQTGNTFYTAALNAEGVTPISTPLTTFSPSSLLNTNENVPAFTTTGSIPLLATMETNSSLVRLYNATNLNSLVLLSSQNLVTPFVANTNATGDLAFGMGPDGLRLYALNTNNGIQAFNVSAVPEPSSIALVTLGAVGIVARRRQLACRKQVS